MDRSTSLILIFVILGNLSLNVKGKIVFGYLYSVVYGMIYIRLQRKYRFQSGFYRGKDNEQDSEFSDYMC